MDHQQNALDLNETYAHGIIKAAKDGDWESVLELGRKILPSANNRQKQRIVDIISAFHDVRSGNTLGHLAAIADQVEVVALLHSLGVNLRKSNYSNHSPLEEARKKASETQKIMKVAEYILHEVYYPVERLFYGQDDYNEMVKLFNKHPEAINDRLEGYNNMSWTCLCAEEARVRELRWLRKKGSDFNVRDDHGNGLLHMLPIPFPDDENSDDESRSAYSSSENEEKNENSDVTGNAEGSISIEKAPNKDIDENLNVGNRNTINRSINEEFVEESCDEAEITDAELQLISSIGPTDGLSDEELRSLQALAFLLSLGIFSLKETNDSGATAAHAVAEKSQNNPRLGWQALRLLLHCGADFNACDDDGANVAMVLASSCGDGPWLTWCLEPRSEGGAGCNPDSADVQGKTLEDHIVKANLEAFDSELDIHEQFEADSESNSSC